MPECGRGYPDATLYDPPVSSRRGYRSEVEGGSPPTLHDVARIAGVSFKTVSNVIHNHPQVRQATRDRVLAAIAETGYRPNIVARNLRSGRSGVIGLAVPELSQAYFAQIGRASCRERV